MAENFANEYASELASSILSGAGSLTVLSATGSPAANFRIRIDDEYLMVTAKAGLTFTVTRGIEGSTAAAHSSGTAVTHVLTAGGLDTTINDAVTSDITEVLTLSGGAYGPSQDVDTYRTVWFDGLAANPSLHYSLSGSAVVPTATLISGTVVMATYVPA